MDFWLWIDLVKTGKDPYHIKLQNKLSYLQPKDLKQNKPHFSHSKMEESAVKKYNF